MSGRSRQVLEINQCVSDGDTSCRPPMDAGYVCGDKYMRVAVAERWIKDRTDVSPHTRVIIDRLPAGYAAFSKVRVNKPSRQDHYIYGHVRGRFDSVVKFYVHFKYLMDNGSATGCPCCNCTSIGRPGSRRISRTSVPQLTDDQADLFDPRQTHRQDGNHTYGQEDLSAEDDDDDNDEYAARPRPSSDSFTAIAEEMRRLCGSESIDRSLQENAEWPSSSNGWSGDEISLFPAHDHRPGELVVFRDDRSSWKVGLVIGNRVSNDNHNIRVKEVSDEQAGAVFVLRLRDTFPFHVWQHVVSERERVRPSDALSAALRTSAGLSVIQPFRLRGTLVRGSPEATINCRGLFIGPDLVLTGDLVALRSHQGAEKTRSNEYILHVTQIKLRMLHFTQSSCEVCVRVSGRLYTTNAAQSHGGFARSPVPRDHKVMQQLTSGLSELYDVFDPLRIQRRLEIPYSRISGRVRGPNAFEQLTKYGVTEDICHELGMGKFAGTEGQTMLWYDNRLQQFELREDDVM